MLCNYKNVIGMYDRMNMWDTFKKYTNEYEMVFCMVQTMIKKKQNNTIARSKPPVSRSYYKLWEIFHDLEIHKQIGGRAIRTCHIAEGPGGFIESMVDYASMHNTTIDAAHGVTLLCGGKRVPDWKFSNAYLTDNNIRLFSGKDNTGDIYNHGVVREFINTAGREKCDIVTADGGFDFSSNFNSQETEIIKLLISEIYIAINTQKSGGLFVCKMFDTLSIETMRLIQLLTHFYSSISIIKPYTSRPANGEKYIVCNGFDSTSTRIRNTYRNILKLMIEDYEKHKHCIDNIVLDEQTIIGILEYNTLSVYKQVTNIAKTIGIIDNFTKSNLQKQFLNAIEDRHREKCMKWCRTYNII